MRNTIHTEKPKIIIKQAETIPREFASRKIKILLQDVGRDYEERGIARLITLHEGHDIHAFYRLTKDQSKVIHVQGYPGLSSEQEAHVWARLMDYDKLMRIRLEGVAEHTIGNEHEATIKKFDNFGYGCGADIPYDPKVLEKMLAKNVPELNKNQNSRKSSE